MMALSTSNFLLSFVSVPGNPYLKFLSQLGNICRKSCADYKASLEAYQVLGKNRAISLHWDMILGGTRLGQSDYSRFY